MAKDDFNLAIMLSPHLHSLIPTAHVYGLYFTIHTLLFMLVTIYHSQPTISGPVPSHGHYGFHSFPVVD
jgi:hypothetical protein